MAHGVRCYRCQWPLERVLRAMNHYLLRRGEQIAVSKFLNGFAGDGGVWRMGLWGDGEGESSSTILSDSKAI